MNIPSKIVLVFGIVLSTIIGLIVIGTIGANLPFEDITLHVLTVKNLFLGVIKIAPLIVIAGSMSLLIKQLKNG